MSRRKELARKHKQEKQMAKGRERKLEKSRKRLGNVFQEALRKQERDQRKLDLRKQQELFDKLKALHEKETLLRNQTITTKTVVTTDGNICDKVE